MELDIFHLVAFGIGFVVSVSKDILQQKVFMWNMEKLGEQESDEELEKIMKAGKAGFGLNEEEPAPEDKDSSNIETNYKSYFS